MSRSPKQLLVVLGCLALLTGCGSSKASNASTTTASTSTTSTTSWLATTTTLAATKTPPVTAVVVDSNCPTFATTAELEACFEASLKTVDTQLNSVYQALLVKYTGADRDHLITGEQAWIKSRDSACAKWQQKDSSGNYVNGAQSAWQFPKCELDQTVSQNGLLILKLNTP